MSRLAYACAHVCAAGETIGVTFVITYKESTVAAIRAGNRMVKKGKKLWRKTIDTQEARYPV